MLFWVRGSLKPAYKHLFFLAFHAEECNDYLRCWIYRFIFPVYLHIYLAAIYLNFITAIQFHDVRSALLSFDSHSFFLSFLLRSPYFYFYFLNLCHIKLKYYKGLCYLSIFRYKISTFSCVIHNQMHFRKRNPTFKI